MATSLLYVGQSGPGELFRQFIEKGLNTINVDALRMNKQSLAEENCSNENGSTVPIWIYKRPDTASMCVC